MPRTRTYGLDIDTIRYAQRVKSGSGTTILPEPLKQINKFVIGIKKLGLWNSMVCWPMRGIHNAGTGSTLYSLGGSGTYNGTMVNSPTWGFNGITTNGSNSRLTISIPPIRNLTAMSIMARATTTDSSSFPTYWHYSKKTISPNNWHFNFISYLNDTGLGIFAQFANAPWSPSRGNGNNSTSFGFQSISLNSLTTSHQTSLNGSFTSHTSTSGLTEDLIEIVIGSRWEGSYTQFGAGTHSMFIHINTPLNYILVEQIRTLYKRTLGIGLNLP